MDIIRAFFILDFKVSKPIKTSEKDHSFLNIVLFKKPHSFYESQITCHWKWYTTETGSKSFLTLQIFQQTCFCLASEKKFALHNFLTTKNCILEALWKQMYISFVYFCVSPWGNLCSKDVVRFYLVGWEEGERWKISLMWLAVWAL